jgi:hypothetical protein
MELEFISAPTLESRRGEEKITKVERGTKNFHAISSAGKKSKSL